MISNQKYNLIYFCAIAFLIFSCKQVQNIYGLETSGCKIEKEIDGETHYYSISCEEWSAEIDYGFGVYSNNETYTPEDYLLNEKWKILAIPKISFASTAKVNVEKIVDSINVISVDDSLNAKLRYLGQDFDYKISIPPGIVNFVEEKDVLGSITSRLIYDKESMRVFKYFLINNDNVSNGSPEAIAINLKSTRILEIEEIQILLSNVSLP